MLPSPLMLTHAFHFLSGRGNAEASDQMSDILAQVAANVDGARNAGNAVLYECVQVWGKGGEVKGANSMGRGHGLVAAMQARRCCECVQV